MDRCEPPVRSLIVRAREDHSSLGHLLERYRPSLWAMARRRVSTQLAVRNDASDIVQQTLAEAYRAFPIFRGESELEFSAWIKRIHERNLKEAVRKHVGTAKQSIHRERALTGLSRSASLRWLEPVGKQTSPSQLLIRGERALQLAAMLESLPEMQCQAIRLRHLEGWPIDRIASTLERTLPATAGLIKRGLRTLRARLVAQSWAGSAEGAP